jgi:KDO2-lipid IV(A) lauroyltransferase
VVFADPAVLAKISPWTVVGRERGSPEEMALQANNWSQYLAYVLVRVAVCVLQTLRMETCQVLARWVATICHDWLRIRADVVDENLRFAFPELSDAQRRNLSWRMWEHLILFVAEVAHAPRKIHETNWREFVEMRDGDRLARIALGERASLLVSAHFGNFELGGFVLGILGIPTHAVARPLDNPYLDRFVSRFRGLTGQKIIRKQGGYDEILRVLTGRGMIAFLADQYAGIKGCWITFFGRPASAHKAIALLALDNDAYMIVASTRRLSRPLHFEMVTHGIVDPRSSAAEVSNVKKFTQWYTSELEQAIRAGPEQYWWLHRRWKDTRPPGRRQRAAA